MFFLIFILLHEQAGRADSYVWFQPWKSTHQLVEVLSTVAEGRELLAVAATANPKYAEQVVVGAASFTESTFPDEYTAIEAAKGSIQKNQLTIKRGLPLSDAVADFAHELWHFSKKKMLDPYKPGFTQEAFVRQGLEGEGGELKALETECRVAWALEKAHPAFPKHRFCERYRAPAGFDETKAQGDYFALGKWFKNFDPALKAKFPLLSERVYLFTSGYSGKPYPLEFADEFTRNLQAACEANLAMRRKIAPRLKQKRPFAETWEDKKNLETLEKFLRASCIKK